eukprot:CAMPEP_0119042340 /NCGR_PEP_ID=MMETSP1177-20130426/14616_1 /TAXON_ID=2985 /ORGANISM="Ochromonas sp, Strain CCMP1899" /LENGTH=417 /DNA_ID=CAMNT_0007009053 /DNA_START=385 /DNA_END=1638 /DNA_ORIENTATION=-
MRLGGNGNCKLFMKKHGVPESQMESEKKYKTKAAQEYRRHLTKLQNEEHASGSALEIVKEQETEKGLGVKWESTSGLDDMMSSMSGKDSPPPPSAATSTKSNETVFTFKSSVTESAPPTPTPVPVVVAPKVFAPPPPPTPVAAIGSLSVAALNTKTEDKGKDDFGDFAFDNDIPMKVVGKVGPKKGVVPKKSIGSRILSSTPDDRFESFESVEKRAARAVQEAEDHKVAANLQSQENNGGSNGSSRLDAIYKEEAESIYRTATPVAAATSSMYGSSKSSGNAYATSSASTSGSFKSDGPESYQARNKYASNKGISSDQFFGRDEEDMEIMKTRLAKMGSATAIGSDMLSDDAPPEWQGSPSSPGGNNGGRSVDHRGGRSNSYYEGEGDRGVARVNHSIDQMKDSVTNFFGDIQRRMG